MEGKLNIILIKKLYILVLLFLTLSTKYVFADNTSNTLNDIYMQFLIENNIPIAFSEERFIVDEKIKENDLIKFFELLVLSSNIIANNIANANTTKTGDGGPFVRSSIYVKDGEIYIFKDEGNTSRFVYDPTHPDAIQTGSRTGYVEMPNVDIVSEMLHLIYVYRIYENIIEECLLKNINIPEIYKMGRNSGNEEFINEVLENMQIRN